MTQYLVGNGTARKERVYELTWQKQAKCGRVDIEVPAVEEFFLDAGRDDDAEFNRRITAVKDFCTGAQDGMECPVLSECLRHALVNRESYGCWGGTFPAERAKMRRLRSVGSGSG